MFALECFLCGEFLVDIFACVIKINWVLLGCKKHSLFLGGGGWWEGGISLDLATCITVC